MQTHFGRKKCCRKSLENFFTCHARWQGSVRTTTLALAARHVLAYSARTMSKFPSNRMRRLRYHPAVRELVRTTRLSPANFILPLFVRPGRDVRQPISSMPGHFQLSVAEIVAEARQAQNLGLGGVILFGIPAGKDAVGSDSYSEQGIVQQAV